MARKQQRPGEGNVTKFPVRSRSEAEIRGEFVVPAEQQAALRELDKGGADLQKQLGAARLDFLVREADLTRRFGENRNAYEKTVKDIAKQGGLDFDVLKEPWDFNFDTMTFRRRGPAQEAVPTSLPQPPSIQPPVSPPGSNGVPR